MDVFDGGAQRCIFDYLEIQNGYSSDGAASGRECGKPNKILTYYSTLDTLRLRFFSDGSNEMQSVGFKATYTQLNFTPPGKCSFVERGEDTVCQAVFSEWCTVYT